METGENCIIHDTCSSSDVIQVIKKDEMGGECSTYKEEEKCMQGFDGET